MKKILIIIAVVIFVFVALNLVLNPNAFKGPEDMENFTNVNNRCSSEDFIVNPSSIPETGCFSITELNQVKGIVADHELVIKRDEKGVVKFLLNNVELSSTYESNSGNNYKYSSPYVVAAGTYSWMICSDKDHLKCPTQIDFTGDSSDQTSTSSSFVVSVCTGGEQKGSCKAGKIVSNHCRGKYCFE